MRLRLLISLSLWLLAAQAARAQTAGDYFNSGAQSYISNNLASAWQTVETGRKLFPDDVKLKKLEELLKQQSQQQQQNQQQQNQQNQQSQSKQQQQKNQQSQSGNSGQQQNQPQPNPSARNPPNPPPSDRPQAGQGGEQEKTGEPENPNGETAAREMTPEEARRLLDAQKGDEQILQFKPAEPPKSRKLPTKDW